MFGFVLKRIGIGSKNWYQRNVRGEHRADSEIRLHDATVYKTEKEAEKHTYPVIDKKKVLYRVWKVQKVKLFWNNNRLSIKEVK